MRVDYIYDAIAAEPRRARMLLPALKPSIQHSKILRVPYLPRDPSRSRSRSSTSSKTHASSNQSWSLFSTAATISDDEIARLSSKPLHSLTLTDLVK